MREIARPPLPSRAQAFLRQRQAAANEQRALGTLDIDRHWKSARRRRTFDVVLKTLQRAMGRRERCMYCLDSHGSDIDHFRPKARFPQDAYQWNNMLVCCSECGRFKGSQFPMAKGRALLIDPTAEDPWRHLDFDPHTGNLVARFDIKANDWSASGAKTVEVLRLDRREAMAAGYAKTYRRLTAIVQDSLAKLTDGTTSATALWAALQDADDHGLLPWCLRGTGQTFAPFTELRQRHAAVWQSCLRSCG